MPTSRRLQYAIDSLEGLSVGDAFGERFFVGDAAAGAAVNARRTPTGEWPYTDDTQMAMSVVSVLRQCHEIPQGTLAAGFGARYDPARGYGPAMQWLVPQLFGRASEWRELSHSLFDGNGSYGNGAAMRVAPVGAYFFDDLDAAARNAALSAEVTHSHPEAVAGAVAVAISAALAVSYRKSAERDPAAFLHSVAAHTPESEVCDRLRTAAELSRFAGVDMAVRLLGSGSDVTVMDTVPFAIWCAAHALTDYEDALWLTVSGLGDRDTTCAIAGGIVAARVGVEGIPSAWRAAREPLPRWYLREQIEWHFIE